jgi:hypothetical protein
VDYPGMTKKYCNDYNVNWDELGRTCSRSGILKKIGKKYWWENLEGNRPFEDLDEMIRQC